MSLIGDTCQNRDTDEHLLMTISPGLAIEVGRGEAQFPLCKCPLDYKKHKSKESLKSYKVQC